MPIIFTFMFASLPSGLVIYYTWSNFLTLLQQYFMMRKHGVEIHLFNNLKLPWAKSAATKPNAFVGVSISIQPFALRISLIGVPLSMRATTL